MRRPTAALLGTVAGTVLLVGVKFGVSAPSAIGADPAAAAAQGGGGGGEPVPGAEDAGASGDPQPPASGAPPAAGPSARPSGSLPGRPAPTTTATRAAGPGPTTGAPPPAPACTTASGGGTNVSDPGTGAVTVSITVCNKTITVSSGSLSKSNWSANTRALPSLNSLAVTYYKTNFSMIHYSGATLTSNAYQTSLRAAMSKAGL